MTCEICHAAHDPRRCQAHVDDARRAAYANGGRQARLSAAKGQPRQCRNPVRFSSVCPMHGGEAGQVKAAAVRRATLHEALVAGDRRHPMEVLADALHITDTVAQRAREMTAAGQPVTAEVLQALLESVRSSASMARLLLDSGGADWSAQEAARREGEAMGRIVTAALRLLGLDPENREVTAAMRAATRLVVFADRVPAREFAERRAMAAKVNGRRSGSGPLEIEAEVVGDGD